MSTTVILEPRKLRSTEGSDMPRAKDSLGVDPRAALGTSPLLLLPRDIQMKMGELAAVGRDQWLAV